MSVNQKLGIILVKLSLEKNVFTKKWSPKLKFLDAFFLKKMVDICHEKLTLNVCMILALFDEP